MDINLHQIVEVRKTYTRESNTLFLADPPHSKSKKGFWSWFSGDSEESNYSEKSYRFVDIYGKYFGSEGWPISELSQFNCFFKDGKIFSYPRIIIILSNKDEKVLFFKTDEEMLRAYKDLLEEMIAAGIVTKNIN